jgi:signal transduction histidine kinase
MLNTILRNLLGNAVKFTSENGAIRISLSRKDGFVELGVHDSGVGMNEEQLTGLFRIEGYHSTTGTGGEIGTGLGLVISKEFVEKHGGTIRVESQAGKGSSFFFTLPMSS